MIVHTLNSNNGYVDFCLVLAAEARNVVNLMGINVQLLAFLK